MSVSKSVLRVDPINHFMNKCKIQENQIKALLELDTLSEKKATEDSQISGCIPWKKEKSLIFN